MTKRWTFLPPAPNLPALCDALKVGPLLAQVLVNRGHTTAEAGRAFLHAGYEQLHRPELMPGLERAAERIVRAIKNREKVALYGDYDVDGLTGVAVLYQCLMLAGLKTTLYVPHRIEEGYGLNCAALEQLAAEGHTLVISADCGVTSIREAVRARELGLDLIITDHHEPDEHALPDAYVIVNPKLPGSTYPFRDLAGVGVAFKLAWAVGLTLSESRTCRPEFQRFLTDATGLVALGTIADVVPLVDENRAMVAVGLKALSTKITHPGLKAIVESARLTDNQVKERDVAFVIGPRLNAAGRMGHAREALRLLTEASAEEAMQIARQLEEENRRRQDVEREIRDQAIEMIESRPGKLPRILVLSRPGWHAGVIGIVAARLVELYHRPTLLITQEDDYGQGSGRSIPGFNLFQALEPCADLLRSFGGHKMAAGLRMDLANLEAVRARLEEYADRTMKPEDLVPSLAIDAETTLVSLTTATVKELLRLAPFGQGNSRPIFAATGCTLAAPPSRMGKGGSHLALNISQGGVCLRATWWGAGGLADELAKARTVDIAFRPRINTFRNTESVELDLQDLHVDGYKEPVVVE